MTSPELEVKVAMLENRTVVTADAILELKNALRRIEDVIGVIRLVESQSTQQQKTVDKLQDQMEGLEKEMSGHRLETSTKLQGVGTSISRQLEDAVTKLQTAMVEASAETATALKAVEKKSGTVENEWKEKYNIGKGLWLAFSAIWILFGGGIVFFLKSYYNDFQDVRGYVNEQRMREAIRKEQPAPSPMFRNQSILPPVTSDAQRGDQ